MEQMENEHFDSFLLQMEHKFNGIGEKEERGTEEKDFGMGFQMWLPEEFKEGDKEEAADIFWSEERPPVLFLTSDRRAGLMFRQLDGSAGASACREKVRHVIRRTDERTVFYSSGEAGKQGNILWLVYKSFASDERVYNLAFLFMAGEKCILGIFYCIFEDYEKWEPMVFEMLDTIKADNAEDEYEGR